MSKPTVINGRVATQTDVDEGRCVFFIPNEQSRPFDFDRQLPISAVITLAPTGGDFPPEGTIVEIVQAETVDDGEVILGVIYDQQAVCSLTDIEILA